MTTLIIGKKPDTTNHRRCDAKCYNAKGPICKCICGGINHGKGFSAALTNIFLCKEIPETADTALHLLFPHVQQQLFPLERS